MRFENAIGKNVKQMHFKNVKKLWEKKGEKNMKNIRKNVEKPGNYMWFLI